jgi:uncharacterized membrane protein
MDAKLYAALDESLRRVERAYANLRATLSAAEPLSEPPPEPEPEPESEPESEPEPVPTPGPATHTKPKRPAFSFEAFFAGRGLQLVGAFLVLLGAAFFLNLAFTRDWIGPAERIALGLVCGAALVGAGARALRPKGTPIAEGLIGLGAGILYLSLWASVAIFPELDVPRSAAFVAMVVVTSVLVLFAARRRNEHVALLALAGGFLTPVLLHSAQPERALLAGYVLILGIAFAALGAHARFRFVEGTVFIASLLYLPEFLPVAGEWTTAAAYGVTTALFVLFAITFSAGARRNADAASAHLILLAVDAVAYVTMLTIIFQGNQTTFGVALLLLSAASLVAARYVPALRSLTLIYGYLGLTAGTLAVPALLHGYALLDTLAFEGAFLTILGARLNQRPVAVAGAALVATATVWVLGKTVVTLPTETAFSSLTLAYAVVVAAIAFARTQLATLFREEPATADWSPVAGVVVNLIALVGICRVLLDGLGGPFWNEAVPSQAQVALSLASATYATVLFGFGLSRRSALLQRQGLVLLAITILKVFVVDLSNVDIAWRIVSFVALGTICMGVSAWYLRARARAEREQAA